MGASAKHAIGRMFVAILVSICAAGSAGGAHLAASGHGEIIAQDLDPQNRGYTVLRVWGSHYEMGYAQAELMGDYIMQGVDETKSLLGSYSYNLLRGIMAAAIWMPAEIEDESDAAVDCLAISHPNEDIDDLFEVLANWT